MSIANLVVELELKDGKYHSRMSAARKEADSLSSSLGGVDKRLKNVERSVGGSIPKIRDLAIITASVHSVFATANETVGRFVKSIVDSNAEIERTKVLLSGLSKSVDTEGKLADAAKDMQFLFNASKNAPFALKEISNSFVKMKTVGISDVENKVRNLTDAIANFGGDDQTLHRATVAIQQMASKGVISMEELRQQLGEAVPSAMQAMADGMGMTVSTLVDNISKGKVRAIPAIEAMMREMEFSMAGSSVRMMDTWNGMVSQLSTNWMLLQKQVGDAGFFDAIKEELKSLNEFLQSDSALKYAQILGDGMRDGIDVFKSLTKVVVENKEAITSAALAVGKFWLATKAVSVASSTFGGLSSFLSSVKKERESFSKLTDAIVSPTVTLQKKFMGIEFGSQVLKTQVPQWKKAMQIAGAAVPLLTGPIGTIAIALGAAGAAYVDFKNEAVRNIEEIARRQAKLNNSGRPTEGSAVLKTSDDIEKAKLDLEEFKKAKQRLEREVNSLKEPGRAGIRRLANRDDSDLKDAEAELSKKMQELDNVNQAIAQSTAELFDRTTERETVAVKASIDKILSSKTTQFNKEVEMLNKLTEKMKANGTKQVDIEKFKHESMVRIQKDATEEKIASMESELQKATSDMDRLSSLNKTAPIRKIIDKEKILKDLEDVKLNAMTASFEIQSKIDESNDEGEKSSLSKQLEIKNETVEKTKAKIKLIKDEIASLKSNQNLKEEDILSYIKGNGILEYVNEQLKTLKARLDDLKQGKLVGDGAIQDGSTEKEDQKRLDAYRNRFSALKAKLASSVSEEMKLYQKELNKSSAKFDLDSLDGLLESIKNRVKEKGDIEREYSSNGQSGSIGNVFSLTSEMLSQDENTLQEEDLKSNIELTSVLIDTLNFQKNAEDELTQSIQERTKAQESANRAQIYLNTSNDIGKQESSRTIELKTQLEDAKKAGLDVRILQQALSESIEKDKLAALEEGYKKTAAKRDEWSQQEKEAIEKTEVFKEEFQKKTLDDLIQSQAEYNADGAALYKKSIDDQVEEIRRRAAEEYGMYGESLDSFVKAEKDKLEAMKRNTDKMIAEEIKRQSARELRDSALGRNTSLTQEDRDNQAARNSYQDRIDEIARSSMGPESRQAEMSSAFDQYADKLEQIKFDNRSAFEQMMQDAVSFKQVAGDAATTFTDGMLDGITMLMTEGTANFKKFAASVLQDIGKMLIKMALLKAVQMAFGFFGGGAPTGAESAGIAAGQSTGNPFIGVGPYQSFGSINKHGSVITPFATGGMMSQSEMDKGGVKSTPHLALFAEAGVPEAFIPMHDGKSIPISLTRDANGKLTASALLPGGRSIPATIAQSNISAFAMGGSIGAMGGSQAGIGIPNAMTDFVGAITDASARIKGIESSQNQSRAAEGATGKGGDNISFTIQINNEQGDQKSKDVGDKKEMWNKMSERVKQVVSDELIKQKRPGGLLWEPK